MTDFIIRYGFYAIGGLMALIVAVEIASRWWFPEPISDPIEDEYPEPRTFNQRKDKRT